jgi:hypothetical protein
MYFGYTIKYKAHITEIVTKANNVVRCVWGIGEGGDFSEVMMFESMIEYIDVRARDLGMEGTRRGRESERSVRGIG